MRFSLSTKGSNDIIDITLQISQVVKDSKIRDGVCFLSSPGSTVGLTTIEAEPNLLSDFKEFLENIAPLDKSYLVAPSAGISICPLRSNLALKRVCAQNTT